MNAGKAFLFLAAFSLAYSLASAQEATFEARAGAEAFAGPFRYKPSLFSDAVSAEASFSTPFFFIEAGLSFLNDGKYSPFANYELNHYFQMEDCLTGLRYGGLSLSGGRGKPADAIDTPYALFFSAPADHPVYLDLEYEAGYFSYVSRWVQLSRDSSFAYEGTDLPVSDSGMNYKAYSIDLGSLRFGVQEASVYLYENFNVESFLNPAPAYVQQLIVYSSDRPYSQAQNPNSLMGAFAEYRKGGLGLNAQLLLDDINASFLAPALGWLIPALNEIENVSKFAWSLGGSYRFPFGKLGIHHAGATKYAFESTYTSAANYSGIVYAGLAPDYAILPYGYTYHPFSAYSYGGVEHVVGYADNYIGFKYGENALAFMVDYENAFLEGGPWSFDLSASLEYAINGSKSPANPWHELDTWIGIGRPIVLFDESVLEHGLVASADLSKRYKAWDFYFHAELGYVWNRLALVPVEGRPLEAGIWRPIRGNGAPVAGFNLGCGYRLGFEK